MISWQPRRRTRRRTPLAIDLIELAGVTAAMAALGVAYALLQHLGLLT